MSVDGASVERIIITNITLRNIKGTAIFLRLANRGKLYRPNNATRIGQMKDILIQNIYGTEIERYGCSITGIPQASLENIVLDNINLTFKGGDIPLLFEGYPDRPVAEVHPEVPELESIYPRGEMFGKLPAYGFYVRHVNHITFNDIRLKPLDTKENRPAIITDDVKDAFYHSSVRKDDTGRFPSDEKSSVADVLSQQ
jgi:hypothetical protein